MNHCLPLVLIAILGFSFSACTGGTETPKQPSEQQKTTPSKYIPLLIKAEKGNTQAQFDMAILFMQGKIGTKDLKEAFQWFKKAADNGDIIPIPSLNSV
jgi:TPR repeat protein